jgi:steroid 5-alpha reductase family enzyme
MTLGPLLAASVGLMIIMTIAWAVHRKTKNAGWIDALWTFGTGLCASGAALAAVAGTPTQRQILVASFAMIWAVRLGTHIVRRNLKRPDDPRYAAIHAGYGADADRRFFWFLQQQAWCGGILIAAIYVAAGRPGAGLTPQDLVGGAILIVALLGEALADRQLRRFGDVPANRGRVCDHGLWRFSRHPNYFFEWLGWLAYPIIAIDLGGAYVWGWFALAAPALMYWLLVYVSGIPPLEEQMLASRGAAYASYRNRTNAFFPGPQRRV